MLKKPRPRTVQQGPRLPWVLGLASGFYSISVSAIESDNGRRFSEHIELSPNLLVVLLLILSIWLGYRLLKSRLEILNISAIDFHALADNAQDGILIVQNERLVYANQRAGDILGYADEELPGMNLKDIVHPDEAERVLDRHRRRMRGEDVSKQYEVSFSNKRGNRVPVELTAAVTSWQGHPAGLVIIRDITERKLIEKTLLDSEKRYRSLVENSPDAIMIIDAEGNAIIEANEQAAQLFKLSKQDLFSIAPEQLSPPVPDKSGQKPFSHYMQRALHGVPLIFERDFQDRHGEAFSCEIRLSRMPFPNRRLIRCSLIDITPRKLYQSALARSEERLAGFFQASFETLIFHDKGIILDINHVVEDMFGYTREEAIGHHVLEFVAAESQQLAGENMGKGEEGPYELTAVHKNGRCFPVQVRAKTLQQDDMYQRIVAVADVSSLKQATDRLQASEQNLQHIIDNMIDTFYRLDWHGKFLIVSPSARDLLGYRPEELIGADMAKLFLDPYGRDFFLGALEKNNGVLTAYESPLLHKNGTIVWVSTNAKFIYDTEGNLNGVEGVSRNITRQRDTKEALQTALTDSEQNFRTLFENAPDTYLLCDTKGRILDVNRRACEKLGYNRDELLQMDINDIDIRPDPVNLQAHLTALQHQPTVRFEGIHQHKAGGTFPVEVRLALLNMGKEKRILALVCDTTTRQPAEHRLLSDGDQAERPGRETADLE